MHWALLPPRASLLAACVCACVCTVRPAASADRPDPALSRRPPAEIVALVRRLEATTAPQQGDTLRGGLVLREQVIVDTDASRHIVVRNRVVRVLDPAVGALSTVVLRTPEGFEVERAEGWTVRADGRFERLGKRSVHRTPAGGDAGAAVALAFEGLRPGDVLGASLVLSARFPVRYLELFPSGPQRVGQAEIELHNEPSTSYRAVGANVTEQGFSAEVLQRHDGNATSSVLRFRDLPPAARGQWLCPATVREPVARIGRYGSYDPRFRDWFRSSSWGMVALELDAVLQRAMVRQGDVRGRAASVTRGLTNDAERAAALCRHVRDALADVPFAEASGQVRTVEALLSAHEANPWEKGILLAALLNAARIPAQLFWARDGAQGPLQELEPSPWQFTDVLVRSEADPFVWYAPARRLCPAGMLPASLQGARSFALAPDLAAQHDGLVMEIFGMRGEASAFVEQFYRQDPGAILRHQSISESFPSYLVGQYLHRLQNQQWYAFDTVPREQPSPAGALSEQVTIDPGSGELRLYLEASGTARAMLAGRAGEDPRSAMGRYLAQRFPGALVLEAGDSPMAAAPGPGAHAPTSGVQPPAGEPTLRLTARVGAQSVAPPPADTWVLPPEVLFGEPLLADWLASAATCFQASSTLDLERTTRLPLPAGWAAVAPIPAYQFDWGPLSYRAEVTTVDTTVVLTRRLHVGEGSVAGAEVRAVEEVARRIAEHERVPTVLVRASAPDPAPGGGAPR